MKRPENGRRSVPERRAELLRVLYARSQYWFGLRAGGSVGHTAGFLWALSRRATVEVITNDRLHAAPEVPTTHVPPLLVQAGFAGELLYNLRWGKRLAATLERFRPHAVYHRASGASVATATQARRKGIPLILEFNSSARWTAKYWRSRTLRSLAAAPVKQAFFAWSEPYLLRSASLVVVVSRALRDRLIDEGIPEEKILVNPNAVDPERFRPLPPARVREVRRNLGIVRDAVVAGFASTFGPWHGVDVLGRAIERVAARGGCRAPVIFLLFGDGPLRPQLERKLSRVPEARFVGTVDYECMPEYLAACDILLSPQGPTPDGREFFGSPTKLFEYMATGRAIVASRLGQIAEVIESGRTGILVPPGDDEALAEAVNALAEEPRLRARLGEEARREVLRKHTWDHHVDRLLDAMHGLGISFWTHPRDTRAKRGQPPPRAPDLETNDSGKARRGGVGR